MRIFFQFPLLGRVLDTMRTPQNGEKIGTDVRRKRLPRRLALQITRIRVTTWTSMRRLSSEETPNSFEKRKKEKKCPRLRMRACLCKRTKQRVEPRADERAHFSVSLLIRHLREVKRSSAAAPPRIFFFFVIYGRGFVCFHAPAPASRWCGSGW